MLKKPGSPAGRAAAAGGAEAAENRRHCRAPEVRRAVLAAIHLPDEAAFSHRLSAGSEVW